MHFNRRTNDVSCQAFFQQHRLPPRSNCVVFSSVLSVPQWFIS